jgi:hypothetical protein
MDAIAELRMFERLLAVGIGGMSIYLGYCLFLALPDLRDSSGEVRLPTDIRVVIARVGPGAFFALFGAAVVALSLYTAVRYDLAASVASQGRAAVEEHSFAGLGQQPSGRDSAATERADARALLRGDMAELNALTDKLSQDLSEQDRAGVAGLVRRVKLKLLHPLWERGWGDATEFENWLTGGGLDPPPKFAAPAELYFYGTPPKKP